MLDSPVDEIKQKIDIVDLVQEYIPLKQSGVNFRACCPFHHEKTPSFFVSREKQIWHCFGACSTGGDVFKFIMQMEGMEFGDALKFLARKAGVTLKRQNPELQTRKNKYFQILDLASRFYHEALLKSRSGEKAREYVKKRGIDDLTCDQFRLGFAPDRWDELYKFLRKKGFREQDISDCGLIIKKQFSTNRSFSAMNSEPLTKNHVSSATNHEPLTMNYYDRFRSRLMFPIWNAHNDVVGFTGRHLEIGEKSPAFSGAKYINTPQTFVYDKSRVLYGLNFAKQAISRQKKVVVVEGNMDGLTSHQVGVKNVVASSGTALALPQIELLKRYTKNVILAFDMDLAGDNATKRGIDLAVSNGLNVKISRVPDAKDPDEFIKTHGATAWQKVIDSAISIMDYYFSSTLEKLNLQNVEDKKRAADVLLPVIANLPDKIEQVHYLQKLAKMLGVEETDLRANLKAQKTGQYKYRRNAKISDVKKTSISELFLKQLLGLMIKFPDNISFVEKNLSETYLPEGDLKGLYKMLIKEYNISKGLDFADLSLKLKNVDENLPQMLGEAYLYYEKETSGNSPEKEAKALIQRLGRETLKKRLGNFQEKMQEAEKNKDSKTINELAQLVRQTSEELSHIDRTNA